MDEVLFGWYRRLSLRTRFTVLITASLVVLFAALVPAVVYLERRAVLEGAWERGLQLTKIFAHASVQGLVANDFLVVRHVINSVASEPDVLYAMIVDPKGRILAHSDVRQRGQIASDPLAERAIAAESPLGQEVFDPNLKAYEFAVPIYVLTERRATARVGLSLRRELADIERTRNLVMALGGLAILAGLGVATWQARTVTRPLADLVHGAQNIAAGNLGDRIPAHGAGEISQLGLAFNQMAHALEARIGELKGAQDEVVRKTRLAAIGEIAAVMAHEIRNPLGAISNCAQVLRKHAPLSPENAELLEIIKSEADRLNAIVSDFLAYGRPRSPVFQHVDIHESIDEALRMLRRDARCTPSIAIAKKYGASGLTVRADPDQLRQIFWNLLINAVQAMDGAGTITVETTECGGRLDVVVADTGCGIPPTDVARLFEPFQTRRAAGIGLGLATVRRIVEDHGGHVSMDSVPGVGTQVLVSLPHGG